MSKLSFDIAVNSSDLVQKTEQIRSAIHSTALDMGGQGQNLGLSLQQMADSVNLEASIITNALKDMHRQINSAINSLSKVESENQVRLGHLRNTSVRTTENKMSNAESSVQTEIISRENLSIDISDQFKTLVQINEELSNYQQKLLEVRTELSNLNNEIVLVCTEMEQMRNAGLQNTDVFAMLEEKLGSLSDALKDLGEGISQTSNLDGKFQGMTLGLNGLYGALTTATSMMSLFSVENEHLQNIMQKVQSAIAITNGLQAVNAALSKDSAFQLNVLGQLKLWWRNITLQVAASQGIETAAASTGAIVNLGLAGSFHAVGLAIKSIPVIGWILAGISALISLYSLWSSKTEKQKEQQEQMNKSVKEFSESVQNHAAAPVAKIEILSAKFKALGNDINAQNKFITDNKKAFDELGVSINNVKDAQQLLIDNKDKFVKAQIAKAISLTYSEQVQKEAKNYIDALSAADAWQNGVNKRLQNIERIKSGKVQIDGKEYTLRENKIGTKKTEAEMLNERALLQEDERILDYDKKKVAFYQEKANASLAKMNYSIKRALDFENTENSIMKQIMPDSNTSGTSGNSGKERQTENIGEQQEKYKTLVDKQKLERIRTNEDLQMQVDETNIKGMAESSEKTIAQMEFNFEKEMQAIDRQKEDALQKKINDERAIWEANPNNKGKYFDAAGIELSDDDIRKYDTLYKAQMESFEKDKQRMELQHMQSYLAGYETLQQKKLNISQEYNKKINSSQNEWEKKSLAKEKNSKILSLETEAIKTDIEWATVFVGFGEIFNDMVKPTLEEAKKYVETDEFKDSDQAAQKALMDTIKQMEKSMGGTRGLNFKQLGQEVQLYQNSLRGLINARNEEVDAFNKLKKAQSDYNKALENGTEQEKQAAKDARDNAQTNADSASLNVKKQTDIVNQNNQSVSDTATILKTNMSSVTDGLSKLASGGVKNAYEGFLQIGKGVGGSLGKISDKLEDVPIIGWIISIIDVLKDGLSNLVGGLLDSIFNAISGIISDVLSGDLFVTIGKSLSSGIGKILNVISFGGFNSLFGIGGNAKETAEKITSLTASNESLKASIDGLTKKMNESNGAKSVEYYQKAKDAQVRSNENYRQILDTQMGYNNAHHSNAYYWDLKDWDLNQVRGLLGNNIENSWAAFSQLTAEQMNDIRTNLPDVWRHMIEQGKYGDRFKDDWNNYADQAGKIDGLTEKINENIAQISFESIRDSFVDSLMDMDVSAKEFAGKFEEYLMKSMLNFAIGDMLDKDLKEWYASWAKTIGKQGGTLSDTQLESYKQQWDEMVQKGINKRDELAALTGYDTSSSSSQESSKNGFTTMSQDTGDELNGRFTALQISNEEIKNSMLFVLGSLSSLCTTASDGNILLMEMRNLAIMSNGHLEDIAKYTKTMLGFGEKLDNIDRNTQKI